jgi:preprotein translocase subunit SecE
MGQTEKAPKQSWFRGLKQEYSKISWADRKSVVKQTVAVVSVSVAVGLIIALMDWVIQYGVDFLLGLSF